MKRGDVVLVVIAGDFGKPRPAVIVQGDLLNTDDAQSFLVAPMTTTLTDARTIRVPVSPSPGNGLCKPSEIMTEKASAVMRSRLRDVVGHLDEETMGALDRALLVVLGFA